MQLNDARKSNYGPERAGNLHVQRWTCTVPGKRKMQDELVSILETSRLFPISVICRLSGPIHSDHINLPRVRIAIKKNKD